MSIQPQKHNIHEVFGTQKYHIDFYQRDYRWRKNHVQSLLDDIFYKFEGDYRPDVDVKPDTIAGFPWYYLSTYVTNTHGGKTFIVDGQQRFTTLTLVLIKLYHLAKSFGLEDSLVNWLRNKICGFGPEGESYWMGYNDRASVLDALLRNPDQFEQPESPGITAANMYANYAYVSEYLNDKLTEPHRCTAFIMYFLTRIFLIEIGIDDHKDVAMVFEVINDRGERLRPYEVFKGELLGQLSKEDVDEYYQIWKTHVDELQLISEDETDSFFRCYFRSKFVDTRSDYRDFDGEYHRTVLSTKWNPQLKLKRQPQNVKDFLKGDFDYSADLYQRLLADADREKSFLYFNALNELDRQYVLIMSAVERHDKQEKEKVELVARLFDRHFSVLQLMGCYDSNSFTDSIIFLNASIRNKHIDEIQHSFDALLLKDICEARGTQVDDPFQWGFFTEASNSLGSRFVRYFFARVEHFISENTGEPTASYHNLVKNTGPVNGYHIEHILAENEENRKLFGNDKGKEVNDKEVFYKERNRLGAICLLLGPKNLASNSEPYTEKLKTYATGTLWARTLTHDFYHKNKNFLDFAQKHGLDFRPIDVYDQQAVETRQKLLFELTKIIWGVRK